jgi:hypothetical protein
MIVRRASAALRGAWPIGLLALSLPGIQAISRFGRSRPHVWFSLRVVTLSGALFMLWVTSQRLGGAAGVAAGACMVVIAALPTVLRLRYDVLDPVGVYGAFSVCIFGLTSFLWMGRPLWPAPGIDQADVTDALAIVAIGLLAFTAGAWPFGPARRRERLAMPNRSLPPALLLIGLLVVSAAGAAVGISSRIIGIGSHARPPVGALAVSQPLYQLAMLGSLVVLATALVTFACGHRYRFLIALTLVQVLIGFFAGFKGLSLIPVALVFLAYISCAGRIPWRPIMITLIVALLVILPANALYRQIRAPAQYSRSSSPLQIASRQFKVYTLFRFREIDHVALIHARTPSTYPYAGGSRYIALPALMIVPRALWPDKPILNDGLAFSHSYWQIPPYLNTASPLTQTGDLYRSFGFAGVIIGLCIWGAVVGGFGAACRRWRSPRVEMILLFSLITWVANVEVDLPELILTTSKTVPALVVLSWLLLPGSRQDPGYRILLRHLGRLLPHDAERAAVSFPRNSGRG